MEKSQKSVLLKKEEKEIIESASKKLGLTYAGFLRSSALKEARKILGETNYAKTNN